MAPRFLSRSLLLLALAVLQACCGTSECDCQDAHADALALQFNVDSTTTAGFRSAELDTVVLIRQAINEKVVPRADTTQVVRSRATVGQPILLERRTPFPVREALQLDDFTYSVLLPRATTSQRFELTEVLIEGNFEADGCCTCYRNRRKSLQVNGQPQDLTDPAGNNALLPVLLPRL